MTTDIIQRMKDGIRIEVNGDREAIFVCIEMLEKMGFQIGFNFEQVVEQCGIHSFNYVYVNTAGFIHMQSVSSGIGNMKFHRFRELAGEYRPEKLQPADFTDLYDWF